MEPINEKIIHRAMAKSIVHDTGDLIKLVKKYEPIGKNITYADLLLTVQDLLATNNKFVEDYGRFLIKKKRIVDYNNAVGVVSGIAGLFGSLINSGASKKQAQALQAQAMAGNTQQLMQLMMQEEQSRMAAKQQKNTVVYIAIGSVVLLTGLLIFTRKSD